MEDINERLAELVAEMEEIGSRTTMSCRVNFNNLLDYRSTREHILELCLAAIEQGYRLVKKEADEAAMKEDPHT